MKDLIIEKTDQSLEVFFSHKGTLLLKGISTPDHVNRFFEPLFEWVREFSKTNPKQVTLEMMIDYLNTSSTRVLIELITLINELQKKGTKVKFIWKYESDDEDMKELGEDLELVSGAKFEFEGVEIEY